MSDRSKIEWTDASYNPVRARETRTGKIGWHCEHVTEGCRNCYAESMNKRLGTGFEYKPGVLHKPFSEVDGVEVFLDEKMLLLPLRWKKPRMIFVCSMTDAFADFVKDEWLDRMFAVMALCPQHTFQVLTKRAERMRAYLTSHDVGGRWAIEATTDYIHPTVGDAIKWSRDGLPNCWLGISCERQQEADERIPLLLQTPAAVRFISAEPLLEPLDLYNGDPDPRLGGHKATHTFLGDWWEPGDNPKGPSRHGLDWVIAGGESGPNARPAHPDWIRSLRDQCAAADVPFFFKQWGEFSYSDAIGIPVMTSKRVGKKAAGRLLDGRTHDDMPGRVG